MPARWDSSGAVVARVVLPPDHHPALISLGTNTARYSHTISARALADRLMPHDPTSTGHNSPVTAITKRMVCQIDH